MSNSICKNYFGRIVEDHSHSLNDESLRALMTENELIINLRSLTVETISEITQKVKYHFHQATSLP